MLDSKRTSKANAQLFSYTHRELQTSPDVSNAVCYFSANIISRCCSIPKYQNTFLEFISRTYEFVKKVCKDYNNVRFFIEKTVNYVTKTFRQAKCMQYFRTYNLKSARRVQLATASCGCLKTFFFFFCWRSSLNLR